MSTNGDKWSSSSQQQQQQQHSAAPWVDEIKLKQSTFGHQLRHNRSKTDDRDLVKSAVDNKHERSTSAETALKKLPISDPATSVKPKLKPGNLPLKPQRVVKSELRSPDDEPIQIRQKSIDKSNVARSVNALTQLFENKNVLIAPSLDFTVEQQTTEQQSAGLENETDSPVRSDRFIVGASDSDDEERKVVSCVKFGRSSKRRKSKENKRSSSKSSSVGSDIDDSTDLATSKFKPSPRPPSFDDVLSEFTHLEQRATDGPLSSPSKPTPPSKPTLPSKPTPPGKPPRTFRHDVYLDSKLNKNHAGPVFVLDPNQQTVTNRQNRDNYEYSSVAVKSTRNNKNDDYFQYDADFSCLRKPKNTAGFSDNSESGENLYESLNRPLKSATVAATEVIYAAPDSSNHSILKRTLSETDQNEYQYVRTIVDTFGVSQDRVRQHALGSDLQSQRSNLQSQRSNLQSQRSTSDECLYARTMSINSDSSTYTDPVEVFSRPVPRQSKQEDVYSAINIPIRNRMLRNPVTTSTRESIDELKKWHAEQKPKLHKIKKLFSQENLLKNMMTSHEQKANKKKARSKIWQIFSGTHRTAAESADEQDSKSNGSGSQFDERDIERQIKRTRSNREKWGFKNLLAKFTELFTAPSDGGNYFILPPMLDLNNNKLNEAYLTQQHQPLISEERHQPLISEERHQPLISEERHQPLISEERHQPLISEERHQPLISEERHQPLISEERHQPLISEERHQPLISEERHQPLISEERYQPLITVNDVNVDDVNVDDVNVDDVNVDDVYVDDISMHRDNLKICRSKKLQKAVSFEEDFIHETMETETPTMESVENNNKPWQLNRFDSVDKRFIIPDIVIEAPPGESDGKRWLNSYSTPFIPGLLRPISNQQLSVSPIVRPISNQQPSISPIVRPITDQRAPISPIVPLIQITDPTGNNVQTDSICVAHGSVARGSIARGSIARGAPENNSINRHPSKLGRIKPFISSGSKLTPHYHSNRRQSITLQKQIIISTPRSIVLKTPCGSCALGKCNSLKTNRSSLKQSLFQKYLDKKPPDDVATSPLLGNDSLTATDDSIRSTARFDERGSLVAMETVVSFGYEINTDLGWSFLTNCLSPNSTASVYTRIRAFRKLIYPSLFDYAIIVGVKKVEGNLIPYIKYKFPHNVKPEEFCIPQFCFPDVSIIKPYSEFKSETYSFVLTNCDGSRNYGYCQRFLPSGKLEVYPIVVCIVSPCGAQSLYHQILSEIEKRYLEQEDLATTFIEIAYSRPLPKPGNTISICVIVSYDNMVQVLGIDNVLKIFASMLSERRIIFSATNLGTLSSCIHAMVALLYPLSWQHTFIPVLPPEMIDIVCSPTPYIVGILTEFMDDVYDLPMEEVLIVNIDEICLYREQKDELTILPNKLRRALFQALQMSFSEPDDATRNLMISEAFMHYFLMTIRHYEDYINVQHDGQKIFQKELFVKSPSSRGIRMFLRWFVETQMFDLFIIDQLEAEAPQSGIFQKQVAEFKESVQQDTGAWSLKDLGKKVKRAFKRRQSRDELNET
ncbi:uncharacterized protein LOC141913088 isoform X2 [Tubulanus polymorphus]|uniref:uncharacterized protein LOC141913088 isoform X2 n=1 Tax=Tubulanus polymorphus TaxID=672921 RepID=UPI003DA646CA